MKRYTHILWISRHQPLKEQKKQLKQLFGDISFTLWQSGVRDAEHVLELKKMFDADEIVTILPLTIIQKLCEIGVYPLYPEMKLIHDNCMIEGCKEYDSSMDYIDFNARKHWRFVKFVRVKSIEMIYEEIKNENFRD
jgi:hypothetical protein